MVWARSKCPSNSGEAATVAQARDRDQFRFGLAVGRRPVGAREAVRASHLQRAIGGVARLVGEGLPLARGEAAAVAVELTDDIDVASGEGVLPAGHDPAT